MGFGRGRACAFRRQGRVRPLGRGRARDYIASGTEPHAGHHRLAFDREIETAIYRGLPDRLASMLRRRPLRCPVGFVRGTESKEIRQAGLAATERLVGDRLLTIEGSHLFPLERPAETADAVLRLLEPMVEASG